MIPYQCARLGGSHIAVLVPRDHSAEVKGLGQQQTFTFPSPVARWARAVMLFFTLLVLCIRLRPHIVHAHSTIAGAVVRVVNVLFLGRMKVVYCAHGWAWDRMSRPMVLRIVTWVERVLSPFSRAIVCISRHDHDTALKLGIRRERLKLIASGIAGDYSPSHEDTSRVQDMPRRKFLFVGRFDKQKGIDMFMSSMRAMGGEADAYALGGFVVDHTDTLDVPPNVDCVGWVPRSQVIAFMSKVDALVMPSRWEGFGLVALEAMRAGLPVIAANVGGLKDLVDDQVTGFLVDVSDPDNLTRAMRQALAADLPAMGEAGRRRFKAKYVSDSMNAELLRVYNSLDNAR